MLSIEINLIEKQIRKTQIKIAENQIKIQTQKVKHSRKRSVWKVAHWPDVNPRLMSAWACDPVDAVPAVNAPLDVPGAIGD